MVQLVLLDDGRLDGHAVVIPTGNDGNAIAAHGLVLVDKVLEHLIECSTHVNIAIGERRTVVQNESGLVRVLRLQARIQIHILPVLEHFGLALRQICAHCERRAGQIQRTCVILSHDKQLLYSKKS